MYTPLPYLTDLVVVLLMGVKSSGFVIVVTFYEILLLLTVGHRSGFRLGVKDSLVIWISSEVTY